MASKIVDHSLDADLTSELQSLLVSACHRISQPRDVAFKILDRLITGFPSLMCDSSLVFALLDILTLLQISCDGEQLDEVRPHPNCYLLPLVSCTQICAVGFSTIPLANSMRNGAVSLSPLRTRITRVARSYLRCTLMRSVGWSWPLLVLLSKFRRPFR